MPKDVARFRSRGWLVAGTVLLGVVAAILACEAMGWPFLVAPIQHRLEAALDRRLELGSGNEISRIRLIGSVRVTAHHVLVGAPPWSSTPHTFLAEDAFVRLRYRDLWHAYRTGHLRIDALSAKHFDGQFERLADGRASWTFKPHAPSAGASATDLPVFGRLNVADGTLTIRDAVTPLDLSVRYTLNDGSAPPPPAASSAAGSGQKVHGLWLVADGHFKKQPLRVRAQTEGVLMLEGVGSGQRAQPLRIDALAGDAKIAFEGSVLDPLHLDGLRGTFDASGPSLSAAGEPLRVTLPATAKFDLNGRLAKDGDVWDVVVDAAHIGSSHLHGAFVFDQRSRVPRLSGRVQGRRLALADLGPAIGEVTQGSSQARPPTRPGRIFPDRPFDFPSLKVMSANVLFDLDELDLGTTALAPFQPARAHLVLDGGLLTLGDIELRTAQGRLVGRGALDSRRDPAMWSTDLDVSGVQLDRFVNVSRKPGEPPYISGQLAARLHATSTGRSIAELLGNLDGQLTARMAHPELSHLALKAAGLDVAGGVKVLLEGDEALALRCNVARLTAQHGVVRPQPVVLSLDNATLWADGQVSLREETMDVRVISAPKDFSPVSLRTPIEVKGALNKPSLSIEPSRIVARAGAAVLLGLLNPLAAIVPFFDPGSRDAARAEDRECSELARRLPAAHTGELAGHRAATRKRG